MSGLAASIHRVRLAALTVEKKGKTNLGLFASYVDVWSTLQPELTKEGLSVAFSTARITFHNEAELISMDLTVSNGAESASWPFEMIVPERIVSGGGKSVTNNSQRVASGESYLKRTALIHFFGMSAGNEDEVERMNPVGDQTNVPGMIVLTDRSVWQDLTEGLWASVQSPGFDGKLGDYPQHNVSIKQLWGEFPNHPGLQAWAADFITSGLQELNLGWADLRLKDPALPNYLTSCNSDELRAAARAVQQLAKGGQP